MATKTLFLKGAKFRGKTLIYGAPPGGLEPAVLPQHSPSGALTINCTLGTADASGFTAQVDRQLAFTATLGTANASGFTAQVDRQLKVDCAIGTADASGFTAQVDRQQTFTAALGTATADGLPANVDLKLEIVASLGAAIASGYDASISFPAGGLTIDCSLGVANVSGFSATVWEGIQLSLTLQQAIRLEAVCRLHGLIDPLVVTETSRGDGVVTQTISGTGPVTVTTTGLPAIGAPTPELLDKLARWYGLLAPMVEQEASRSDGVLSQSVNTVGGSTTLTTL